MVVPIFKQRTMKVKWLTLENSTGERVLKQHAYIPKTKKTPWTLEEYEGNTSLCSKAFASDDGEIASSFDDLESEPLDESIACKICMRKIKRL